MAGRGRCCIWADQGLCPTPYSPQGGPGQLGKGVRQVEAWAPPSPCLETRTRSLSLPLRKAPALVDLWSCRAPLCRGQTRAHPALQRSPGCPLCGIKVCTWYPVSLQAQDVRSRRRAWSLRWSHLRACVLGAGRSGLGPTRFRDRHRPHRPPCWCRAVAHPEPVRGGSGPHPRGLRPGCHAPGSTPHHRKGTWGCQPLPEPALLCPKEHHERPCVFILLSKNGIFSNGDWEMDLVFKKDTDFGDKAKWKYIP